MECQFLEPWAAALPNPKALEDELQIEVGHEHPLFGIHCTAIAQRIDSDDVLFQLNECEHRYAVVHLTWRGAAEPDRRWPFVEYYPNLEEWVDTCMMLDHKNFTEA